MNGETPAPTRASVVAVRARGFVYSVEMGRIECLRCGGRAFTRDRDMVLLWERAHLQCCRKKQVFVSACA